MLPPTCSQPRARNAAATRQAILESARRKFARESYENVGLREIAGEVGVDPALVNRYFGNKECLFREVLRHPNDGEFLDGVTAEALPAYLGELLTVPACEISAEKAEWLLIVMHSAGSPQASQIVRETMREGVLAPVERMLDPDGAELRAALVLAVMMGSGVLNAMGIETLRKGDRRTRDKVAELLAAAVR